ncbi:MAG: hypothetical protein INR69_03865 [Mucilaginibacter polytrichastri]|nr:hypothetical protein [Mucilaginibacter polytrichastri]
MGVVIGEQVIVGDDVMIWQHVTLGSHGKPGQTFQYPVIGDKVKIFTGSTIIGDVKIGENAIVGAASVVLRNVPAEARVAGIPAKELEKRP